MLESLLLSGAGAALGLLFATWGSRALVAQLSMLDSELPSTSRRIGACLASRSRSRRPRRCSSGRRRRFARPAFTRSRRYVERGARGTSEGSARSTNSLVSLQIALSLMLVVAAGLFIQTFGRLVRVPLGFDSDRVLIASVDTARSRAAEADRLAFYQRLADAVRAVPGVEHAAASMDTPLSTARQSPLLPKAERVESVVAPGWFATYGTRIVAGRDFAAEDSAGAPAWRSSTRRSPEVLPEQERDRRTIEGKTIVGMAGDAVFATVRGGTKPTVYMPLAQSAGMGMPGRTAVNIRAAAADHRLTPSVSAALNAVDPGLSFSFRPLQELRRRLGIAGAHPRRAGWTVWRPGVAADRTGPLRRNLVRREQASARIGIRMALGAGPGTCSA